MKNKKVQVHSPISRKKEKGNDRKRARVPFKADARGCGRAKRSKKNSGKRSTQKTPVALLKVEEEQVPRKPHPGFFFPLLFLVCRFLIVPNESSALALNRAVKFWSVCVCVCEREMKEMQANDPLELHRAVGMVFVPVPFREFPW